MIDLDKVKDFAIVLARILYGGVGLEHFTKSFEDCRKGTICPPVLVIFVLSNVICLTALFLTAIFAVVYFFVRGFGSRERRLCLARILRFFGIEDFAANLLQRHSIDCSCKECQPPPPEGEFIVYEPYLGPEPGYQEDIPAVLEPPGYEDDILNILELGGVPEALVAAEESARKEPDKAENSQPYPRQDFYTFNSNHREYRLFSLKLRPSRPLDTPNSPETEYDEPDRYHSIDREFARHAVLNVLAGANPCNEAAKLDDYRERPPGLIIPGFEGRTRMFRKGRRRRLAETSRSHAHRGSV